MRWSTKCWIIGFRPNSTGRPCTSAMLFTLKLDCSELYLYSWLSTTVPMASRFTSYAKRMPVRSL
jgi:hypothetical protein